jgi:hypothetical protein
MMLRAVMNYLSRMSASILKYQATEREILSWLDKQGYLTSSAQFQELELHAIQAPGWLQIFRFRLEVKNRTRQQLLLFGALRSDERYGAPRIRIFESVHERNLILSEWSEGLIVRKSSRR